MTLTRLIPATIILGAMPLAMAQSADPADFEFFKTRVEPIFLKKRPGHGRCVVCHGQGGAPGNFGLVPLTRGSTTWTDEQSLQNYEVAIRMIAPGDPDSSALLVHPLSAVAGGDVFHSGGRQFESKSDPDWQVLAEWVKQAKPPAYSNLKILPPAQLGRTMRNFDVALGVDCNFCHQRDFAADTPHKEMARRMMTMVQQIGATARVTCYTCHRGMENPKTAPDPVPADF